MTGNLEPDGVVPSACRFYTVGHGCFGGLCIAGPAKEPFFFPKQKGEKMFRIIFLLITEPLGLPIEWYYEYLIMGLRLIDGVSISRYEELFKSNLSS